MDYKINSQWPGAFQADVTFRNARPVTMTAWQLRWSFANGQRINQLWGGNYTQTGADVTVTNVAWNGNVPPNGTISFGFIASWSGANNRPPVFTLSGNQCGFGT